MRSRGTTIYSNQMLKEKQDQFLQPSDKKKSRFNTMMINPKIQKQNDLKIQVKTRKVEQFNKMAKIFKSTYKKKDMLLQEIRESQEIQFDINQFGQEKIDTAQIQAEQIFDEVFVMDDSQYLYISQMAQDAQNMSKIEVYGKLNFQNGEDNDNNSQSEEEEYYGPSFKEKNYYLTPEQLESQILDKLQIEDQNCIFFLNYLQERYTEWTDKKIVKISQQRVSQIIDEYFTDEDMNNVEIAEEMTEEPLQYLVDTFELKKKIFQSVFIEQFIISIIKELILTIQQEFNKVNRFKIQEKLNIIFECAKQQIESIQSKKQNMLGTQVITPFKNVSQNNSNQNTQQKNRKFEEKKLSTQINEQSFQTGILNISKQNTNNKNYIQNQIMESNEFLILAEDDCIYNYESLPKDSKILQKCSDEIDENEFQSLASSLQKYIYKSNLENQQIDTQSTDLILLQFLHSYKQTSLKLQEKENQINQYQQKYQLILQQNDYLNEKISEEASQNQENQKLINQQEKELRNSEKYRNQISSINLDLLLESNRILQKQNQEYQNDLRIIKVKYMEQDNIIYELKQKCEEIDQEKQQVQEELDQQNQHFFEIMKNHQNVAKELLFCKDQNMHLQNQLALQYENNDEESYKSQSDDEVVRVNSNHQSDEEFPQSRERLGTQQILVQLENRNGGYDENDIEDNNQIGMTQNINVHLSKSPKKEIEQQNNVKIEKEKSKSILQSGIWNSKFKIRDTQLKQIIREFKQKSIKNKYQIIICDENLPTSQQYSKNQAKLNQIFKNLNDIFALFYQKEGFKQISIQNKFFDCYIEKIHIFFEGDLHQILLLIHRHHIFFLNIENANFFIQPIRLVDIEKIIQCDMNKNNQEVIENLNIRFNNKKQLDDDFVKSQNDFEKIQKSKQKNFGTMKICFQKEKKLPSYKFLAIQIQSSQKQYLHSHFIIVQHNEDNLEKLKTFIDYQQAKVCQNFNEFLPLIIENKSMNDQIQIIQKWKIKDFYFNDIKFNYSMIYSNENEIIEQKKKLNVISDTFYKKKAGFFSKTKIPYKLTHEVPNDAAEKIFKKIYNNYDNLQSKQNKELEEKIKNELEVFILEQLQEQDDFEIHIIEIMKHFQHRFIVSAEKQNSQCLILNSKLIAFYNQHQRVQDNMVNFYFEIQQYYTEIQKKKYYVIMDDSKVLLSEVVKHEFSVDISQKEKVISKWIERINDLKNMDIFDEKNHYDKVKLYLDSMALLKNYSKQVLQEFANRN